MYEITVSTLWSSRKMQLLAVAAVLVFGVSVCHSHRHLLQRERRDVSQSDIFEFIETYDEHEAVDPDVGWYQSPSDTNAHPDSPYLKRKRNKNNKGKKETKNKTKGKGKRGKTPYITSSDSLTESNIIGALGRQLMLTQLYIDERVRSDGGSGLKQIRANRGGTRPYHWAHHNLFGVASIHEHANNIRTVGLGEFVVVLNGVEFRTRHNDYRLYKPHQTDKSYHATQPIEFPDVPPAVLSKETVEEQIEEMRLWFQAFKDQNDTVRDYKQYFKPTLCYLEGAWILGDENVEESFESDRHFLEASSWFDLQEKIRFTSATGRKSQNENFAYLPTTIIEMIDGTVPVFAQWNYRIMCHKLSRDVPLFKLRPIDEVETRFANKWTFDRYLGTRAVRFQLHDHHHSVESAEMANFLDRLMSEIPGKDNYPGSIVDDAMGATVYDVDSTDDETPLNAAYYHRFYKVQRRGAMGISTRHRGFSDPNLFVALTTQEKIAPFKYQQCTGRNRNRNCTTIQQRVSYAIPLEIIYLTPLSKWNPNNIVYKGYFSSVPGRTVNAINVDTGLRRVGLKDPDRAFNGTNSKLFYMTPATFFANQREGNNGEPADTTRNSVGVLDKDGTMHTMMATGMRIVFPEINGVGRIRQRYPIMPVHGEGSAIWKKVSALEDALMQMRRNFALFRDLPPFQGVTVEDLPTTYTFYTSISHRPTVVENHFHTFTMTLEDFNALRTRWIRKVYTTSYVNVHDHELEVQYNRKGEYFVMRTCGGETRCWDAHDRQLFYEED